MDDLNRRVKETIVEALMLEDTADALGDDEDLGQKLGIDSVGLFEIMTALEEEFGVPLEYTSATRQSSMTVQKLAEMVAQAQSMKNTESQ